MERESLIGEGAGPAAKANYTTTPAPAPDSSRPKFIRKTVFGDVRNWKRFAWFEWLFVVVASLSILTILGLSIQRFVYFEQHFTNITVNKVQETKQLINHTNETSITAGSYFCNKWTCTNDFIFTVVLVLNIAFSALYVVHGLLQERMFALVAYSVTVVVIMVYVIVNYWTKGERDARLEPLRLTRLVLVCVAGPINIVLSSIISYKMGFFIFTTVGANTTLIRAYKIRSFFLILQIMLLQALANVVTLSWSRDGLFLSVAEKVILCVLLALCLVVIILGFIAVVFENQWLIPVWYFIVSPYYAYFVYKIVNVSVNFKDDYYQEVTVFNGNKGVTTRFGYIGGAIITACSLGLIVLALMYLFMALTHRNFKKGLKEKVPPPTEQWQGLWRRLSTGVSSKSNTSPIS